MNPPAESNAARPDEPRYVVITGNPNCGKTTVFNALTGLRAKVGNYAGVTVERKEGPLPGAPADLRVRVLDLPGSYSLSPHSMDEQVARDVLLQRLPELPPPSVVVIVVDASNLQRNLYYATQVIELGYPTVIALNMMDVAESIGQRIDPDKLSAELGVAVIPMVASCGDGLTAVRNRIVQELRSGAPVVPRRFRDLPPVLAAEVETLARMLAPLFHERESIAEVEALMLLGSEKARASSRGQYPPDIESAVAEAHARLEASGIDWHGAAIEARYQCLARIQCAVTTITAAPGETPSDRIDRVVTHKVWGSVIFGLVMLLMFQSIFTMARPPMLLLQRAVDWLGGVVGRGIPPGDLNSLLVDGIIAGVGAVVIFLPQILLLFLFLGLLEDTGYMARAAFLMDRIMSKVGLHGKSFIPMLSSFACAIPGIMATRTIESTRDRLVTILIAPLMSCSARLPVYTLLIGACIPEGALWGIFQYAALTLLGMYLLGILAALVMARLFKSTILKGEPPLLIIELPPYRRPLMCQVLRHMWERAGVFLRQAGTIILGINILLWFLAAYPKTDGSSSARPAPTGVTTATPASGSDQLSHSYAGRLGRMIEPVIRPLGFDWRIGIGIVTSFAARETFVSTMSTVYNVGGGDHSGHGLGNIVQTLRAQKRADGSPLYTPLTGLTLMVFYVFALQCATTLVVVRRETNSWRWPLFQWAYLGAMAWAAAFLVRAAGLSLGFQ